MQVQVGRGKDHVVIREKISSTIAVINQIFIIVYKTTGGLIIQSVIVK